MKRSSRIITFLIVSALTYGSLFAIVGPEKVREWHKSHWHHRSHHYHHGHHGHHGDHGDYDKSQKEESDPRDSETEREML